MKTLHTLLKQNIKDKHILMRVDFNVPLVAGKILDKTRILQHKKTIDSLTQAGAKVILLSHFARPKGKKSAACSLVQLLPELKNTLGQDIDFIPAAIGETAAWAIRRSKKNIILAENTRFYKGETENDPLFAQELARNADYFVNDAFSVTHRVHASVVGVAKLLPAFAGLALVEEIAKIEKYLAAPQRPALAIIGGAKITSKVKMLKKILGRMDKVAIGGAMANAFLIALGKMDADSSTLDDEAISQARAVLDEAEKQNTPILLPVDFACAAKLEEGQKVENCALDKIPPHHGCFDIGTESLRAIEAEIEQAKTILWNGPVGAFEIKPFDRASVAIAKKIASSDGVSVAGGGETLSVIQGVIQGVIHNAEAESGFTHLSTGGGALLAWLEQEPLPALQVLA